jgi:hypothetical protein
MGGTSEHSQLQLKPSAVRFSERHARLKFCRLEKAARLAQFALDEACLIVIRLDRAGSFFATRCASGLSEPKKTLRVPTLA